MSREISKHTIIAIAIALTLTMGAFQSMVPSASAQPSEREQTLYVTGKYTYLDPENFNIYVAAYGSRSGRGAHQLIHEYFFYINLETGEYIPWLAEGYEYSPDYTEITVYLTEGAKWSDGEPFTADDVVFTYNLLLEHPQLALSAFVTDWVDRVEKIDDYTVKFFLTRPNPRFHLNRDAFPVVRIWGGLTILPKHVWEGEDPLTFKFYPPIGTGPYEVVSAAETVMMYERRDDWWVTEKFGVRPGPKYVVYQNFGAEDVVAARYAMNDIDCDIKVLTLGSLLKVRETNPYVRAWYVTKPYAWLDPCPRMLFINNARYPWNNAEVRRAISYLIDRDTLAEIAYDGITTPSWGIHPDYGGLKPYFDAIEDLIETYEPTAYNPAKAAEILTGLGWTMGADGVWRTENGTRVEMTYLVDSGNTELMKVSAVLPDQLEAGGIDVTVTTLSGVPFSHALLIGDWDAMHFWICPGDTDPYDNLEALHSRNTRPLGEEVSWGDKNCWRYINPAYDAIVEELEATSPDDLETCKALFRDAMEIFFEDLPIAPTVQAPGLVSLNYYYWIGWPSADDPWNMPVPWWATFNTVICGYKSTITGEWVGGLRPRTIDYATVYFTEATPEFRGVDLTWYGPFERGDAARIPEDDAEFWVGKGYASYKYIPPELAELEEAMSGLEGTVSGLEGTVSGLEDAISALEAAVPAGFEDIIAAMAEITSAVGETTDAMAEVTTTMGEVTDAMGDVITRLGDVTDTLSDVADSVTATEEAVGTSTGTLSTLLYATIAIEAVVLILVAIALIRKK